MSRPGSFFIGRKPAPATAQPTGPGRAECTSSPQVAQPESGKTWEKAGGRGRAGGRQQRAIAASDDDCRRESAIAIRSARREGAWRRKGFAAATRLRQWLLQLESGNLAGPGERHTEGVADLLHRFAARETIAAEPAGFVALCLLHAFQRAAQRDLAGMNCWPAPRITGCEDLSRRRAGGKRVRHDIDPVGFRSP
jgi:hypothetical protein